MNFYIISYDVINASDDKNKVVLNDLIDLVSSKLGGDVTNRPVMSTVIFTSNYSFDEVRSSVFNWSQRNKCYYVISQIASDASSELSCRMVANEQLEKSLSEIKQAR